MVGQPMMRYFLEHTPTLYEFDVMPKLNWAKDELKRFNNPDVRIIARKDGQDIYEMYFINNKFKRKKL